MRNILFSTELNVRILAKKTYSSSKKKKKKRGKESRIYICAIDSKW